jgi:hypothetical protein
MELPSAFAILTVTGLVHASFQLSVSMLTLLSSHTIGKKRSQERLVLLTHSFVVGAGFMTLLLLSLTALVLQTILRAAPLDLTWTILCGIMVGLAVAVLLFYYRKGRGTVLWIPRQMALYLTKRAKATSHSAEAFALGLTSVVGELIFVIVPVIVAALTLLQFDSSLQLMGIAYYTIISLSSLFIVHVLIGSGHSISVLQRWREQNKGFLQLAAGSALLILGFYIYVDQVMTVAVLATGQSSW